MKTKITTLILALLTFASFNLMAKSTEGSPKNAKISKAQAEKIALGEVKNGKIIETELEDEKGTLVYEVELSTPDSKDNTEVKIDANTGKVLSVEKESEKHEEHEDHDDDKK
jgi:uncharacterized membrane protein YkoI